MPRRTAVRSALVAAVVAVLATGLLVAAPEVQAARPGTLTGLGCIGDTDGGVQDEANTCAATNEHINGTGMPVVNKAGTFVYVASWLDDAVVWFERAGDGSLTPAGCIADAPAPAGCAEAPGLAKVWTMRLSPDGHQLYAVGDNDQAVVRLNVAADGSLSDGGCVSAPGGECAQTAVGLDAPYSLDISPDGKDVYVGSWNSDGALVQLRRSASGALTPATCLAAADAGCGVAAGVSAVSWTAVSPDGRSVYVTSHNGGVVMLARNTTTGALTSQGCLSDTDKDASLGCAGHAKAIDGAEGLVVSGDGKSVYVAANADNAITHLRRAADGRLTDAGCVQDLNNGVPANNGCASSVDGLDQVIFVTIDPDDDQVLTGSVGDNAVAVFNRDATGGLTASSCIADSDEAGGTCATSTEGLNGSFNLALSPDGKNVYVGGYSDHALTILKRTLAKPATTLSAAKKQKLKALVATVRTDSRASVKLTGTAVATYKVKVGKKVKTVHKKFVLQPVTATLLPDKAVTKKLAVKKSATLRKLLADGAKVALTLTATATNDGGRTTKKSTVTVRR